MEDSDRILVDSENNRIDVHLHLENDDNTCTCGCKAISKGWYVQTFQTLPLQNMETYIHVRQRRWICKNTACDVNTFTNPITTVRARYQHRGILLDTLIWALSIFCSSSAAAEICRQLGITISDDTITRMIQSVVIEDDPDAWFVGIDDIACRKGMTYCTAIYNMETHQLLALLPGRRAKELKEWLEKHKKVKIVARDRASAYAAAVKEVLPECIQVADRFHLLQNLLERLRGIFQVDVPALFFFKDGKELEEKPKKISVPVIPVDSKEFNEVHYDNSDPVRADGTIITFDSKSRDPNSKQYLKQAESRKEKYETAMALRKEWQMFIDSGEKPKKKYFQEKYGISNYTLNKYLSMTDEEVEQLLERKEYQKRKTDVDDYINMIYKMLRDGYSPAFIYSYILHQGYTGSVASLRNHITTIALNNFKIVCNRGTFTKEDYPSDLTVISRWDVLKYMTTTDPSQRENSKVSEYYDYLKTKYTSIEFCDTVWNTFDAILMGSNPNLLDGFLAEYEETPIAPFVSGIKKDIAPVKNAISYDVSSGPVEGSNCRFKQIKRTMFGRCSLELLFHRFYIVSSIFHGGKVVMDFVKN